MAIFYNGDDYLALPREPQPWVIKKLIPASGLVNIYGPPKSRKSWAVLGMAEAISNGKPDWNGLPVLRHGPVAYIQADTPREEWAGRIARMKKHGYNVSKIFFADGLTLPSNQLNVLDKKQIDLLREIIGDIKPVLTVVDTLRESFRGDENSSDIMQNVVGNLVYATRPSAVMLVAHKRKDNAMSKEMGNEDLLEDARGSGYVSGRMDNIIRLTEHRLTVKGRAVKQTSWPVEEAPDIDDEDPDAPPLWVVFEDDGKDLLVATVQQMLQDQPTLTLAAAAKMLVANKATKLSVDHLRKTVLPPLFERFKPRLAEAA
jgi:hypothetical protein